MVDIPVIDISDNTKGLSRACRDYGFFQIIGHGISPNLIDDLWRVSRTFFALPMEEKRKISRTFENTMGYFDRELTKTKRDQKEIFDFMNTPFPELPDDHPKNRSAIDGINQWPEGEPEFKKVLKTYFSACTTLAHTVLESFCLDLQLDQTFFKQAFGPNHSSFMRLNHYPVSDVLSQDEAFKAQGLGGKALHPHTDAGVLTLLLQDSVSGLQAKVKGKWVDVPPIEGAIVVNVGDLMQIWSNDRYKAAVHRVRQMENSNRLSVPFFFNPAYETLCTPILRDNDKPLYHPVRWGDFRAKRAEGDFADYGKEVQISDFRIGA